MTKLKKHPKNLITPSVRFDDEKHILEEIFDETPNEMPTLKSVGFARVEGTATWISYTITTKGDKVLKIDVDEPNLRQIAEESAKTAFVNELMNQELL